MKRTIQMLLSAFAGLALLAAGAGECEAAAGPLRPMGFLAGHCYKGTLADGHDTDEHCFKWIYEGQVLRDVHTVRGPGHGDYTGETIYYFDSAANRIEYLYVEDLGGIMRGTVEPREGVITFPAANYVAGGEVMTLRVRWTLQKDGYEAWSEMQDKDAWKTMFKVKMVKSRD
ncbi:MAG: hypothetical protein ACXWF0_07920 [Usitatibacter sp.]